MIKSAFIAAVTSSAVLALSPAPSLANTLEPAAAAFAEAAAAGQPIYQGSLHESEFYVR
ncbi:hypothetical protein [Novosphingobium sp. 17-62-19]|uniref:hypothetical protein n=1 Tax=Novosphingobium sp. 17-62-19 TaxID=1970406 RepID=UPI0025F4B601|nr:hypothetical protein [Novosphingobium sp. 17-62-19]HQS97240.1 hypothetical protein [Novosphingobium sp.]